MKIINGLRYLWYLSTRKKAKPDSFINWLRFANAGMLNEPSDHLIVEIGSFCGPNYLFRKIG
ncbi:hypothetical protein [Parapedobacter koreensis]|uniref:hypothetical protein n=1 Tax=Parapedobacter koreensis TaxID=332977 RepID=UPI000B8998CF|nr:hypothetical protein [Parapedobacter koreensis]